MTLLVQKYGGTSIGSTDQIKTVAARIRATRADGHDVVVVLSAMGDTTDRLADLAGKACAEPSARELDALLATGEQMSVALMSMVLNSTGCPAKSYCGHQIGILTDSTHGKARIKNVATETLRSDLDAGCVPVVAGFQGIDEKGATTTLGRGGSDTTAVALAAALDATECQILTDVDGVYTTDPRMVPSARRLDRITFEEMLELSGQGSRVLQLRALEFAGKFRVPLRVMSSSRDGPGTLISFEDASVEAPVISGIAFSRDEAELSLARIPDRPGVIRDILEPIAAADIEVDMIVVNSPRDGLVDVGFTVNRTHFDKVRELVERTIEQWPDCVLKGDNRVAKVSLVGLGMRSHAGVAATAFECLAREEINVRMVSTSEVKIAVLLDEVQLEKAVNSLHKAFDLATNADHTEK